MEFFLLPSAAAQVPTGPEPVARWPYAESASVAGDLFPLDQRLTDSAGACVDLRERLRRGPLIVVFFRG